MNIPIEVDSYTDEEIELWEIYDLTMEDLGDLLIILNNSITNSGRWDEFRRKLEKLTRSK